MRIVVGVLLVLAIAAGISGISAYSYNLGLAQGVAQGSAQSSAPSGQAPAPAPGVPYPMHPYGYGWYGPYGYGFHGPFGFGFFGFLWPLLWIVLIIFIVRALFRGPRGYWGRGPWGYGPGGHGPCGGGGGPQWLEEWHRRQHEAKGQAGTV
jgi:hypothetical protein